MSVSLCNLGSTSGGGGLTPKFQEFNSSGTFTPTQALIDAGGYIEIFLVAGGGRSFGYNQSFGGEVLMKKMYLSSTSGCAVTIGSGATTIRSNGGNSSFNGSSAGGINLTATGGKYESTNYAILSPSWPGGNGVFGYGAALLNSTEGPAATLANSGQAGNGLFAGSSGYCLIKWYE